MDRTAIEQKLESLRRCAARVEDKCPSTLDVLAADPDLQDIIVVNLSRAVQFCVDIACHLVSVAEQPAPNTMDDSFTALAKLGAIDERLAERLTKAVGFRNIAIYSLVGCAPRTGFLQS